MAKGFRVTQHISASPDVVWAHLTDFKNAHNWMPGIDRMEFASGEQLEIGTVLKFGARGTQHQTHVAALERGKRLVLSSTQGGVTAVYEYLLVPSGDGTQITLNAECKATGLWKLVHPVIVLAMRRADSPQLENLKTLIERDAARGI